MRGSKRRNPAGWFFLAGAALGFFAPGAAVLPVCGVVLLLCLAGKH